MTPDSAHRPDASDVLAAGQDAVERAGRAASAAAAAVKPRLRGWLHLGAAPLALAAGIVLVALAPAGLPRISAAVYAAASVLLFGTSAVYHLGRWGAATHAVLRRMDHANIYLIIAGTYTPFVLLVLEGRLRVWMTSLVWGAALAGMVFKVLWLNAPRWLSTALYIALGWVAVFFIPQLVGGSGMAAWILILVGGLLYSLGGVVYATKWPDPAPRWFGFHEVFHALTVAAYVVQYVAVSFVVYAAA
ncbi:PAQR family membrane homeostasis protein TrhA [Allonocardiopsis opalescens]|uniref:Hemolysin III n=1 Tax=Allonocardiopsis opalescens TaxID=1144618 RepID=A0A2T0QFK4_9ACTN|nr:hemolysin III family protein [Allonocardiopsis opalescens]PRY02716.1 hemolysin III [Allonocardiopsis opalescens]